MRLESDMRVSVHRLPGGSQRMSDSRGRWKHGSRLPGIVQRLQVGERVAHRCVRRPMHGLADRQPQLRYVRAFLRERLDVRSRRPLLPADLGGRAHDLERELRFVLCGYSGVYGRWWKREQQLRRRSVSRRRTVHYGAGPACLTRSRTSARRLWESTGFSRRTFGTSFRNASAFGVKAPPVTKITRSARSGATA